MDTFKTYIKEQKSKLKIPPKIKDNYKISGDFSNINKWKAKIILGTSMSKENKIGDWDNVAYVLIGLNTEYIIPVARSDEHRVGYELYYHLRDKGLIPKDTYQSICGDGNHYIPGDDEKKQHYKALQIFKKYGGSNIEIYQKGHAGSLENYFKNNGNVMVPEGEISEYGKDFIKDLERLAVLYSKILKTDSEKLTNDFYGLIPHNLGSGVRGQMTHLLLDSISKIDQKEYDLDKCVSMAQRRRLEFLLKEREEKKKKDTCPIRP
jgi:hypothetical protein